MKIIRPDRLAIPGTSIRVYVDLRDWWVGYYRSRTHHYVCPLPTLVVRWRRFR